MLSLSLSFVTLNSFTHTLLQLQHHNFRLLVVPVPFTTANSVRMTTTDYLLSLCDTDTNSEHLPMADIAETQFICGRGNLAVSFI